MKNSPDCLQEDDNDEDGSFAKSIAATLRRLDAKTKAKAKLEIMKILYEAEFSNNYGLSVPSCYNTT